MPQGDAEKPLLSATDPAPFEIVNAAGASDICLVCEHAGRAVPARLGDLGVSAGDMDRHIAYDIGAEALARSLSTALDAPLALQRYSRLVVDSNRPFEAPDCIPSVSDGTQVPANAKLSEAERRRRWDQIHQAFHGAVEGLLDGHAANHGRTHLVALHSFTPELAGAVRLCHLGLLFRRDRRLADAIRANLPAVPRIEVAMNEPYAIDDLSDYTIPVHGERRGVPHVLIEVRNDQIADAAGVATWSALLAQALTGAVASMRDAA